MKKISVGVIGSGFIGEVHIENLLRISDLVDLRALAVREIRDHSQKYPGLKITESWKEIIQDNEIEAIHICTPNYLHYEMVKEAIMAGKHVLCEKPLCMTSEEASELVELADEAEVFAAIHFNLRFYPLVLNLKKRIELKFLDRLLAVHGSYLQDWLLFQNDYNWRLESSQSGSTRVIGDIGSHWFDLTEFLTGEKIESLIAEFSIFHKTRIKPKYGISSFSTIEESKEDWLEYKVDTEDFATVMFKMSGGIHGCVTLSQVSAGRKNNLSIEIDGMGSSSLWNSETPNSMTFGYRKEYNKSLIKDPSLLEPEISHFASYPGGHAEGFADGCKQLYKLFYNSISNKTMHTYIPTFRDGMREVRIAEAIFESSQKREWVDL